MLFKLLQKYGEEYRSIITKKIKRAIILPYYNIEGASSYLDGIKSCKKREYAIKFLEKIGFDVEQYKKDNYTEPLSKEIVSILEHYVGWIRYGFSSNIKDINLWAPLRYFIQDNPYNDQKKKIKLINHLLGKQHEQITEENFYEFTLTNEYQEILGKINELNRIYDEVREEYIEWEKQLQPYEDFIKFEQDRKKNILDKKKIELFKTIESKLPLATKEAIADKTIEEKCNIIFGNDDLSYEFNIECFSTKTMDELTLLDGINGYKEILIKQQINYLKALGVNIDTDELLKSIEENGINFYLSYISQDDIKKYIPSQDFINNCPSLREKTYEDAIKEYYTTRRDFVDIINLFGNGQEFSQLIYDNIKNKNVCILGEGGSVNGEFVSIMFYTLREAGSSFGAFVHECGHIIDQNGAGTGFETSQSFNEKNTYDKAFRKYEKFNETLNDIFTIEAVEFLHNEGIYLIESKQFTIMDISNHNTALITKKLLQPLLQRFRKQVIEAKVNNAPEKLIEYIGKYNFEELVDAVNKVDYLSRNGVVPKINTSPEDEMVKEYFRQIERVDKIYRNIDEYFHNYLNYSKYVKCIENAYYDDFPKKR